MRPTAYCFKMGDELIGKALCNGFATFIGSHSLTAKQLYFAAVAMKAAERLPFVTPGAGVLLTFSWEDEGGDSSSIVVEIGGDSIRLGSASTTYSPEVGGDHETRTVAEFGVGWRQCYYMSLLDWLATFKDYVAAPETVVWFDDSVGKNDIDWDLEPTTDDDWIDEDEFDSSPADWPPD